MLNICALWNKCIRMIMMAAFGLITILMLGALSCNHKQNGIVRDPYFLVYLDTASFTDHNILCFRSSDKTAYIVISDKLKSDSLQLSADKYMSLRRATQYALCLTPLDSLPVLKLHSFNLSRPFEYHVFLDHRYDIDSVDLDIPVWNSDGQFLTKVYQSEDIYGTYIKLKNR